MKPSHPRIRSLLAVGSALGFLTALLSSAADWLPSMESPLAFAAPNGGFATVRGIVKIESKIQPRSVAINFYSRRGGPAAPPKPTTPVNELENVVLYLETNFKGPFPRRTTAIEPTIRQKNVPGLALAYLLATIIRRALGGVIEAADAVGGGDFSHRAPVWAEDEIGHLGVAFNRMTERLSFTHQQLLRRHREVSILNAIAHATSRSLRVEDVLKGALDNVCDLTGAERGRLCLLADSTVVTTFLYLAGPPSVLIREAPPSGIRCTCFDLLTRRRSLDRGLPGVWQIGRAHV